MKFFYKTKTHRKYIKNVLTSLVLDRIKLAYKFRFKMCVHEVEVLLNWEQTKNKN